MIYDFHIKNRKTTLFIALYNGRIDRSHIVETQEIILINFTNTIVQNIVMAYSHVLMFMLGGKMGVGRLGEGGHYFLLIKFFKILYKKMFKIFYMVPLGSYVTFSPNLSKFSGWRKYRG